MNCLCSFRSKEKSNLHERVSKNNKYCEVVTCNEENNILKYNRGQKALKVPFVVYADFKAILGKTSTYDNPEAPHTTEIHVFI